MAGQRPLDAHDSEDAVPEQNEHLRELVDHLDGLAAAVTDAHGSQRMTQYLDGIQGAVNGWGGALPVDPGHPERRQTADTRSPHSPRSVMAMLVRASPSMDFTGYRRNAVTIAMDPSWALWAW